MKVISINPTQDYTDALNQTSEVLRKGGACVMPTDTLYGLMSNALDTEAVRKVFDIKRRNYGKALPILVRDLAWAKELAYILPEQEKVINSFWPGKVTFIFPRRPIIPAITCGGGQTIGLRAPDYDFLQKLLQNFGYPLTGTSANLTGQKPSDKASEIIAELENATVLPDLIIDVGQLPQSEPSTIVDLSERQPRILRQGAVRADLIIRAFSN